MDYEKKYKEALERARKFYNELAACRTKQKVAAIFPELAESEDEIHRKWILEYLYDGLRKADEQFKDHFRSAIAWLEKQKESLHIPETCKENADSFTDEKDRNIRGCIGMALADVSESRFKIYGVTLKECLAYLEKQKENIEKEYVFRPLAGTDINNAALQAIRRANEGDRLVLAFNGAYIPVRKGCNANKIVDIYEAFIEKQKEQKPRWEINNPHTTKWTKEIIDERFEELVEKYHKQKPVEWSETKELVFKDICNHLEVEGYSGWVLLLNALHNGEFQPKQEWSEKRIADIFEKVGLAKIAREQGNDELTNALQDAMLELSKVENTEWSEEDGLTIANLINYFEGDSLGCSAEEMVQRIKSLRPSWKPSEEQMKALNALNCYGDLSYVGQQNQLISLYNDLKKLKGSVAPMKEID